MFEIRKRSFVVVLFCLLVAYLTLFHQLGVLPFVGSDEPRYALIGKEMLETGDYVTPSLDGRPWLEKPPLLFWMEAASFSTFGVSEWSARLPNAVLAFGLLVALSLFTGARRGVRPGSLTFLLLATSLLYVGYARAATTDLPLTVAYCLSMVSGYLMLTRRSNLHALLLGLGLGLTVLAKGLVAIPLVAGSLALFAILRRTTVAWGGVFLAVGTSLAAAVPWLWMAWEANRENFLITFLVNQHLARLVTDLHHHSQPFWFYVPVLLGGFFPWIVFLPPSARRLWREPEKDEMEIFLWIWAGLPFLFFSVSTGKLAGYVLPVVPALAMLGAMQWDRDLDGTDLTGWMKGGLKVFWALALVLAFGAVFSFWVIFQDPWVGIQLAAVPVGAGLVTHWAASRRSPAGVLLTLVGGTTLALALIHTQAAPVVGKFQSTRELCLRAQPYISEQKPLIFYRFHHFTTYYYAKGKVKQSPLHTPAALLEYVSTTPQAEYIVLTANRGWTELSALHEATLLHQAGNFYLVRLVADSRLTSGLRTLDRAFRRSMEARP